MAGVDSLLKIAAEHGADELRLGSDCAPRILRKGQPLRLSVPDTSTETLRYLLAPLLEPLEEALRRDGEVKTEYRTGGGTRHLVVLTRRGGGDALDFDAVFTTAPSAPRQSPIAESRSAPAGAALAIPGAPSASPPRPIAAPIHVAEPAPSSIASELGALLERAVALGASDLHLQGDEPPALRVDGAFRRLEGTALPSVGGLIAALLDEAQQRALASRGSLDLGYSIAGLGRFRLHVYRAAAGLTAAIRILPRSAPSLQDLHMPVSLVGLCELPHGLVLVCGPTGSGKSATLAALAQEVVRRRGALLVTLEDPVEYAIEPGASGGLVRQRQIGRDTPDFPSGLRDALRADPDALLIGELRDPETIGLALTASETGHLVLASLHSPGAASAIERIVDAYPAGRQHQIRVQLADVLQAVIAQRLLPRAGGSGRIPAVEVLRRSHGVASLIREGKTEQLATAIQSGRKDGMIALEACLAELVRTRQIAREDARAVAGDPAALDAFLV